MEAKWQHKNRGEKEHGSQRMGRRCRDLGGWERAEEITECGENVEFGEKPQYLSICLSVKEIFECNHFSARFEVIDSVLVPSELSFEKKTAHVQE